MRRLAYGFAVLGLSLVGSCQLAFHEADLPDAKTVGCSDGSREAFISTATFPAIAGCEGAWAISGMRQAASCNLQSGNDGVNPTGAGCAAADLCASGWSICAVRADIASHAGSNGCDDSAPGFFAAAIGSKPGTSWLCDDVALTTDDLYGCGVDGEPATGTPNTCGPLTKGSGNACSALEKIWNCPAEASTMEQNTVTKGPGLGGVLCCRS
jgi:hypothetical protein